MSKNTIRMIAAALLCHAFFFTVSSQKFVCRPRALAAVKPVPKLKYNCNPDLTESDDKVLTEPNRVKALRAFAAKLENFATADWWAADPEDLNLCAFRKKAGVFSKAQKGDYDNDVSIFRLVGSERFRVVAVQDPCYQIGFNGSDVFLLTRAGGKTYASLAIDGFYTRADFPLALDYAVEGRETIVEIGTTSGGLGPIDTNYYFTVDPRTNRAVPRKMFKDEEGLTNQVYSSALLGEPEEYELPAGAVSLEVIKNHRLTKSFYVFEDITAYTENNEQKANMIKYTWNGKFYEAPKPR